MSMLPEQYNLANFINACRDPQKLLNEATRLLDHNLQQVNKYILYQKHGRPTNVVTEDWDNLIILDACRYDLFSEYVDLEGNSESIISVASTSAEFMEKTFEGQRFHDTVYVTANGFSHQLDTTIFHEFVSTYPESQRELLDRKLYENYRPQIVREKAVEAYERNQDKRLITHFMQPHGPYFGPKAEKLRSRVRSEHGVEFSAWVTDTDVSSRSDGIVYLMDAAEEGYITSDELREAYVENLELVLDQVKALVDRIDGKTVITADHGELLGERTNIYSRIMGNRFEHPGNVWVPELRIVPWFIIDPGYRRDIVSERPVSTDDVDEETVEEHLKSLGYAS